MKSHSHWATQAGYSEDAGAAPAALVQGMGMGCPFLWATRNWDEREEFYNNCILYSTCFFWRCFFTSPNMDELNIIEASDHSDQQKIGGIRSTIIWIHSPIFKIRKHPQLAMTRIIQSCSGNPMKFLDLFWSNPIAGTSPICLPGLGRKHQLLGVAMLKHKNQPGDGWNQIEE